MEDLEEGFVDYGGWESYENLKRAVPLPAGFADLVDEFAAVGLARLLGQSAEPNVVYSPSCLMLAIGMLMSSSEKDAAKEIRLQLERCANAGKIPQDELEEGFSAFVEHISCNPLADVRSACASWISRTIMEGGSDTVSLDKIARIYGAEARSADFGSPEASDEIKDWIASKTNGMLKPDVQTDAATVALLVSCLYARLSWSREFDPDETEWGDFNTQDGETGDARFMHDEFRGMGYRRGDGFTRVTLPCEGEYTADFVMPDDADDLSDPDFVRRAFSEPDNRLADVELFLPKFEVESAIDGKRLLNGLRMSGVFKMQCECPLVGGPLQVDDVVHCAKVKVDESGLEGAAYAVMTAVGALPPEFKPLEKATIRFDRPFAFRIATDDGVVLFMGCVSDPTVPGNVRFFENEGNRALRDGSANPSARVRKVELGIGGYFQGWETTTLAMDGELVHKNTSYGAEECEDTTEHLGPDGFRRICETMQELGVFDWEEDYFSPVLDGTQWSLSVDDVDGATFSCGGSNAYPEGFAELCRAMGMDFEIYRRSRRTCSTMR